MPRASLACVLLLLATWLTAGDAAIVLAGWTASGDVTVGTDTAADGQPAVLFMRPAGKQDDAGALTAPQPAKPGVWELTGAIRSDLYAQDMSFNGSLAVEFLAADGKRLALRQVVMVQGKTAWRQLKRRIEAPEGATQARLAMQIQKTQGRLWFSGLRLERVGDLRMLRRDRLVVLFSTCRLGSLLYPDDPRFATVTVKSPEALPADQRTLRWELRNYWGAAQSAKQASILIESGHDAKSTTYTARLDMSGLGMATGPWYGVHTELALGSEPARHDDFSLAVLPESRATRYPAADIPFGSHTWNATIKEYFPLAARLGNRRCLAFWDWDTKAPYETGFGTSGYGYDVRVGLPRILGMQPYGMLYPIFKTERGERSYSEEALREGVRKSILAYKPLGLWGFQNGNEPPDHDPEWIAKDVESYRIVYQEAKKTDPSIFIIGSAIGPHEAFFRAGFQDTQDAYNIHHYGDLGDMRQAMRKYQELFATYGGKKPIYSTEIGSKSQGLSRHEIAMDLVKKAVCFFADGGGFFTWFAITYPDHDGSRLGSYSDSMDLYSGVRCMYLPRLDAIAHFNIVDCMLDKRFEKELSYPGGVHGFLFRNQSGECMQALWSDRDQSDVLIPLPGVDEVRLVQIDGRSENLRADRRGISLHLSEEPQLLTYRSFDAPLAEKLEAAALTIAAAPANLPQGVVSEIALSGPAGSEPELVGPFGWTIRRTASSDVAGGRRSVFAIETPAGTMASQGDFRAALRGADGLARALLAFRIPVVGRIEVITRPLPAAASGTAQLEFTLRNNGATAAPVRWQANIVIESPMLSGTYELRNSDPPTARFTDAAEGEQQLAPGQALSRTLALADVDRLAIYRIRITATDDTGRETVAERLMAGFVGVPQAAKPVQLDGKLDEPAWATAPVLAINEDRQFFKSEPMGAWAGVDDLSGSMRLLWDEQFLYVGVDVTDDVFVNQKQDDALWAMDGLQFLIDPYRDQAVRKGRYDYAMGFGQKGEQAWCHLSGDPAVKTGLAPEIRHASVENGKGKGGRTYEVAIPWSRLAPFLPAVDRNLGLAMILNEDDGKSRGGFLGWFSGVHLKEVDLVGDLILTK